MESFSGTIHVNILRVLLIYCLLEIKKKKLLKSLDLPELSLDQQLCYFINDYLNLHSLSEALCLSKASIATFQPLLLLMKRLIIVLYIEANISS